MSDDIQRQILDELEDGAKSFDELKASIYGELPTYSNNSYTREIENEFHEAWEELHRQNKVYLTLDRKLGAGEPAFMRGDPRDE